MAFAHVQSSPGTGIDTLSFPGAPTAGNLIVILARWEGAASADATITQSATGFTMTTRVDNASGDHHLQVGYLIGATTTNTFTITYPGSAIITENCGMEFSSSETATVDTSNTGSGTGTALVSGAISLNASAANWLVLGAASSYSGPQTYSNRLINSVAADGSVNGTGLGNSPYGSLFYRLLSTSFSGGTAAITASVSDAWALNILAFKAGTSGPPPTRYSFANYPKAKLRYDD